MVRMIIYTKNNDNNLRVVLNYDDDDEGDNFKKYSLRNDDEPNHNL